MINNIVQYQKIYNHVWRKHKSRIQTEKKIGEIRNYLIEEINQNKLMGKKRKKVCRVFSYILLIVTSRITELVYIFAFVSSVGIPIGITSSSVGLKICVITAGLKSISQ